MTKTTDLGKQGIIVLGSARSDGNTRMVVEYLSEISHMEVVDLNEFEIGYFEYDNYHRGDDFLPLMERVLEYDVVVFATPVYWYSMSAVMKNFFDRITDLLNAHKDTGRKLRGKYMALISCSGTPGPDPEFSIPFIKTADYLGMYFAGHTTTWASSSGLSPEVKVELQSFTGSLSSILTEEPEQM